MPFLFFNASYMMFMLPALALVLFAQWKVSSTYRKYAQVRNMQNMTGADVARVLMRNEGLDYVQVEMIAGDLTDHDDPRSKVMRLSAGSAQAPEDRRPAGPATAPAGLAPLTSCGLLGRRFALVRVPGPEADVYLC